MKTMVQDNPLRGLGERLVSAGLLNKELALKVFEESTSLNIPFIQHLLKKNILSSTEIANAMALEFGLPFLDLNAFDVNSIPKTIVNHDLIQRNRALPIFIRGKNLYVALSDPTNVNALEELKFHSALNTHCIVVEDDKLENYIEKIIHASEVNLGNLEDEALEKLGLSVIDQEVQGDIHEANDDLVIKYVNKIILDAINKKASDIHFEPYINFYRIRLRIDGILYEIAKPPSNLSGRISARLKVMSRLDISERRIPQDGHFKMAISAHRSIEFRINTCPTVAGEKIVLRIIDPQSTNLDVESLGYDSVQKEAFIKAIHQSQGMVLVTGPTGSGKTVSLYTALNILNTLERNISTVEDPVELNVTGINQVSVNLKTGLTFSNALRAFLRQDPDIIMVGEIRDLETAEIAVKAAQTGHLVLSTLHTNSAAETLTRLLNMGVPTYNIATSVNLIVAQRLARKLCQACRSPVNYPAKALIEMGYKEEDLSETEFYEAQGCKECTNGYLGRIGVYETLVVNEALGRIIMSSGSSLDILDEARRQKMQTLRESALKKAKAGMISLIEVNRITKD